MDKKELQGLLNQSYKRENWKHIIKDVFQKVEFFDPPRSLNSENESVKTSHLIGFITVKDENGEKELAILELNLTDKINLKRNRVSLNNEISNYIDHAKYHGVLALFDQGADDYRFTFSAKSVKFNDTEGDFVTKRTDTKRYTYVLGVNESCKTPADRFYNLAQKKEEATINDVKDAFSVEKVSKEFFDKYKKQFEKFWNYIANREDVDKIFKNNDKEKAIRDFTKKLLGRIVFLHFLQKKGWMGCPADNNEWQGGEKKFMIKLYEQFDNKEQFHSHCLYPLFFDTLNKKRDGDIFFIDGLKEINNTKIPYLNGGLFDTDKRISKQLDFPAEYFEELFEFFSHYNFTIDERDPNDNEVGIDPEMLGHIFENLLEDNKDKGAFYTPKVIVQYMCQESLIEYLKTSLNINNDKDKEEAIEKLIKENLAKKVSDFDLIEDISKALYKVKICDPAIGSGAFPMGMLTEIHNIIEELHDLQPDSVVKGWNSSTAEWEPNIVKKNIIKNSIYGVDIETGAIDIARLRFWLALVVDEKEPVPLPNLDYKIMQGNSLLESFEGIDLSQISNESYYEEEVTHNQYDLFTGDVQKKVNISLDFEDINSIIKQYFNANTPEEKKEIHTKIDKQILNHITLSILEPKKKIEKEIRIYQKKIKKNIASCKTADQIRKVETESSAAKSIKKLKKELGQLLNKEKELNKLSRSNERPFFLWHLFFQDVFEQGGFDIVIGNPPYIDSETMVSIMPKEREVYKSLYKTARGNWDMFVVFIQKGLDLCNDNGCFSYIVPNKLLGAKYSKDIKEYIINYSTIEIRDYSRLKVFKEADVYPLTINISKNKKRNEVSMTTIGEDYSVQLSRDIQYSVFNNDIFWDKYFNDQKITDLIIKLSSFSRLRDCQDISIKGAATVSEAYLIKEIISEDEFKDIKYKKFINTGTIDKYKSLWNIRPTQYIKDSYIKPVILKDSLREINTIRLIQADSSKIIIAGMTRDIEAYFDNEGEYLAGKSTSIIMSEDGDLLKVIMAILNSQLVSFFIDVNYHSLKMSGGYLNISVDLLKSIPFIILEDKQKKEIIRIVDIVVHNEKEDLNTNDLRLELDAIISNCFSLSYDEYSALSSDTSFTKQKYSKYKI